MKSRIGLITGILLIAAVGEAGAAPAELNIYGSSSQASYWAYQAQNYAQSMLGCTATAPVSNGGKHFFVHATRCASIMVPDCEWIPYIGWSCDGSRDLDIRISGIASAEGPLAVAKAAPLDASLVTSTAGACNQANGERAMYASSSTTVCKQVHVGTSDVAGESLTQSSSGQMFGPMGGGQFDVSLGGVDTTGLTPANTVVVPFGFFVNSAVTATTCTAGLVGNYATAASQCDTAPAKGDGVLGAAATITNISREEASLIFSGYVSDWSDLGAYFTAHPAVACLRHAGSGTHSALDLTVMNSNWGANTAAEEAAGSIWFNQGSGDEIKCINGNTTATPTGSLIGAIGYADADQAIGVANTSQNVKQLKYNGFYPTRTAIRNGLYDFYTNAWLYSNPANGATVNALAADLVVYAQNPSNVPTAKANYWAAQGEMKFNRGSDVAYPASVGGAAIPMLP